MNHDQRKGWIEADRLRNEEEAKELEATARKASKESDRKAAKSMAKNERAFTERIARSNSDLKEKNQVEPKREFRPLSNFPDRNEEPSSSEVVALPVPSKALPFIRYDSKATIKGNWIGI